MSSVSNDMRSQKDSVVVELAADNALKTPREAEPGQAVWEGLRAGGKSVAWREVWQRGFREGWICLEESDSTTSNAVSNDLLPTQREREQERERGKVEREGKRGGRKRERERGGRKRGRESVIDTACQLLAIFIIYWQHRHINTRWPSWPAAKIVEL